MKRSSMLDVFTSGLKEIPSCLFSFIKKAFPNAWLYGMISLIPMSFAFITMQILKTITQNIDVSMLVFRILATIGQIIPLSATLYMSEHELSATDEDSSEICIIICALVIVALWQ